MRLFDLHIDTPSLMFSRKAQLDKNELAIDLKRTGCFSEFVALSAVFTPPELSDESGMGFVREVLDYWTKSGARLIKTKRELKGSAHGFIATVEDARVLNGNLEALDELFSLGVRLITLTWRDESIVGGAWNTDEGLTPFGESVLDAMLSLGIIPDVSHASVQTFDDVTALCKARKKPFLATHSNALALTPHRRNLDDAQLKKLARCGGICGVNLYPPFLRGDKADLADVGRHIRHVMRVCGEGGVALGTDLDGVDRLPLGISNVSDLPRLYDHLCDTGLTPRQLDQIFFKNAYQFMLENLPS